MKAYKGYINLKYKPKKNDLITEFYLEASNFTEAASAVAAESSVGTWTEVTTSSQKIRKKLAAKVFSIDRKNRIIKIAYPLELFEKNNIPQLLSSIAGNIFGMKEVRNLKLEDINFPSSFIRSFRGPLYGIPGIRKILKIKKRPLLGTIIKPKLGLSYKQHAKVAFGAWTGGCDIVKDDENLTNQNFNRFQQRIRETLKARDKAEKITGEKKAYMPNVTAETKEMLRRAEFIKRQGGRYAMVDVISCGWSALQTLREKNQDLKLILHAHRAGHAALTRSKKHGISMLVIAKLCRLIGTDQLHIGTIVGKMEGPKAEVVAIDQEVEKKLIKKKGLVLGEKWLHIKPMFAVCSGGLHPGHVPYLIKNLGNNIIIQMGGGIHAHLEGTEAGAIAARQSVDAVMKDISLKEYAKKNKELATALKQWR